MSAETKSFKSMSGKPVNVASNSGHVFVVGADPVALPDVGNLHRAAIDAGCVPVEVAEEKLVKKSEKEKPADNQPSLG